MTLTPEQFKAKIDGKIRSLNIVKEVTFPVATVMADKMRQRIFEKGIGGDNAQIGTYSTTPIYAGKLAFDKTGAFKPRGKNAKFVERTKKSFKFYHETGTSGEIVKTKYKTLAKGSNKKKDGSQRKTMYLAGGYKELRQVQGKESSFVNFKYRTSGGLFTDFGKLAIDGQTVIAKVSRKESADKIQWLTAKYGKETFKHTKSEREFFEQEVTKKLTKYFS